MTNYYLCSDNIDGNERSYMQRIATVLQQAGHTVTIGGVGPNTVQSHGLSSSASGSTGIFLVGGSDAGMYYDFTQSYYKYDKFVVAFASWTATTDKWITENGLRNTPLVRAHDDNYSGGGIREVLGKTAMQYFSEHSDRLQMAYGSSPEAVAQMIMSGSATGSGSEEQQQSNISPLLTGDMTFEELVGEICNGIDLLFLVKKSTVVVTDFETIFAEAKYLRDNYNDSVKGEDVNLWQLEEDSYELEVNQHGFYNTVYVQYKDGMVKESYNEFVRVYGEVPITYHDETVDKTTAIMKAKSYLAAHVRELEMAVNATILTEPEIDIGDMITIENPKTLTNAIKTANGGDPELLFVNGLSTSWDGEGYLESDLECKFAPVSPEKKEVPTSGVASGGETSNASGSFNSCGVSSDGSQVMGIGLPSAVGENKYGYQFYKSVFENKCPFCGNASIVWDWNWGRYSPCKGSAEGGTTEGHFFCKSCDADFSIINGADHESPPRAYLTRISGPDPSSREEAQKLKSGGFS